MTTKYFCPVCKNKVRVSVTIVPEYSVVCDTCHYNCIGLSTEVLKLFLTETDILFKNLTDNLISGFTKRQDDLALELFEKGRLSVEDQDYKKPKYRES